MGHPFRACSTPGWKTQGLVAGSASPPSTRAAAGCVVRTIHELGPLPVVAAHDPRACLQQSEGYYWLFWARFLHSSCLRYSLYVLLKGCAALLGSWAVVFHTLLRIMEGCGKKPSHFLVRTFSCCGWIRGFFVLLKQKSVFSKKILKKSSLLLINYNLPFK